MKFRVSVFQGSPDSTTPLFQAGAHKLATVIAFQGLFRRLNIAFTHFLLLRRQAFLARA